MTATHITTEVGAPEAWVCVCGNTPDTGGFYFSDEAGTEADPDLSGNWNGVNYTCHDCLTVINGITLEVVSQPSTTLSTTN
jgi:hypothetical protein